MQTLDSISVRHAVRSFAARKGQATRRAKKEAAYQAECDAVHRSAFIGSVIHDVENMVHDGGNFTTADILARAGVTSTDGVQIVNAVLNAAAGVGAIRPTGNAIWAVSAEDRLYDDGFRAAARRAAA